MHLKEKIKENDKVRLIGIDRFSDIHYYSVFNQLNICVANVSVGESKICVEFTDWADIYHLEKVLNEIFNNDENTKTI